MATLRAHMAMLRTLASQDPSTTMLQLAMIGAELAAELERLVATHPRPPEEHFGTV